METDCTNLLQDINGFESVAVLVNIEPSCDHASKVWEEQYLHEAVKEKNEGRTIRLRPNCACKSQQGVPRPKKVLLMT
jgi:hypothetical protein